MLDRLIALTLSIFYGITDNFTFARERTFGRRATVLSSFGNRERWWRLTTAYLYRFGVALGVAGGDGCVLLKLLSMETAGFGAPAGLQACASTLAQVVSLRSKASVDAIFTRWSRDLRVLRQYSLLVSVVGGTSKTTLNIPRRQHYHLPHGVLPISILSSPRWVHWRLHGRNRVQASQSRIRKQVLGHAMLMIEFLRERHHLHHDIFFAGAHSDDARLERFRRDGGRERGGFTFP